MIASLRGQEFANNSLDTLIRVDKNVHMQRGFTKLFNTIVTSTIWREDNETRILWITMLAISDRYGEVSGSVPGMAAIANISEEGCRRAITKLESPDPDSRTSDDEGRRIRKIEGGWHITNYEKYRALLSYEERKEYKRIKQRQYRAKASEDVDKRGQLLTNVERGGLGGHSTEAEAEAEVQSTPQPPVVTKKPLPVVTHVKRPSNTRMPDSEWIEQLANDPTYEGINVKREFGKAHQWCKVKGRSLTQRTFINWLNRVDRPMQPPQQQHQKFREV